MICDPGEPGTLWAKVASSVLATLYGQTWRDLSFLDRRLLKLLRTFANLLVCLLDIRENQKSPTMLQEKTK